MITVIFKTGNAVFQFDQKDVKARLEILINEYGVDEAKTILKCIPFQTGETKPIQVKHDYFAYIALELIGAGKGSAFCKNCGKQYRSNQLEAYTVGPNEATFKAVTAKKGGLKRLFRKKPKPFKFGMYCGRGLTCPESHTLIFMVTECISLRV